LATVAIPAAKSELEIVVIINDFSHHDVHRSHDPQRERLMLRGKQGECQVGFPETDADPRQLTVLVPALLLWMVSVLTQIEGEEIHK